MSSSISESKFTNSGGIIKQEWKEMQVKAIERMKENPDEPVSDALRYAGYSESVASKSTQVTKRGSFQALLKKMLPAEMLMSRHGQLIASENETVALGSVKLGYQLHGFLDEAKTPTAVELNVNFNGEPSSMMIEGEVVDITPRNVT